MKIAVIADLHGNMNATLALEKDLKRRNVDKIWCLGDIVGKGPQSDKTFDWAVSNCEWILRGNWDEHLGKKLFDCDAFYHTQLGEKRLEKLLRFPLEKEIVFSGSKIRFLHGRPVLDEVIYTSSSAEVLRPLLFPDYDIVGFADCHRQGLRIEDGIFFNPGSIGNSLGGITKAQYAILEGETNGGEAPLAIQLIQLPYDREAEITAMQKAENHPSKEEYIREVETGVYCRRFQNYGANR